MGRFLKNFKKVKVIGLTATPVILTNTLYAGSVLKMINRTNKSFFNKPLHITQIKEVVEQGFWADLKYEVSEFKEDKLRLNTNLSEYTDDSVSQAYEDNNITEKVIKTINEIKDSVRSILIFCPSIAEAKALSAKIRGSKVVYSGMDQKERDSVILDFKSGKLKIVININILSVGFDYEQLDCVIDTVATASISKYYQKIGRVTRIYPGKKLSYIYDFSGNFNRFGDIRNLTFEEDPVLGWGMFNGQRLLTGVSLQDDPVYKIENVTKKSDPSDYIFKFGKNRGKSIREVSDSYLKWILETFDERKEKSLINKVKKELDGRKNTGHT